MMPHMPPPPTNTHKATTAPPLTPPLPTSTQSLPFYTFMVVILFFFFQAEDGIRDLYVTGVQTCALPICCHGPAPTVNAGPDMRSNPGDTITLAATFTDPDAADAPWTYAVGWGDGSSSTGTAPSPGTPIAATHAYAANGTFKVAVAVTNSGGRTGADTLVVTVVAPSVLVGAGDIADCTKTGDSLTANLMDTIPGTVFADGDNAYPDGSTTVYNNCYGPTWGRFKSRTKPVPGNHDYLTAGAAG